MVACEGACFVGSAGAAALRRVRRSWSPRSLSVRSRRWWSADEAGVRGDGGFRRLLVLVSRPMPGGSVTILRPVSAAFFHAEHGSVSRPGRRRSAPRSLRGRGVAASWSRCLLTPLPVAGVGVGALRASALRAVTGLRPVFARQGMIAERVQFLAMCPALGRAFRQFGLACCLTVGLVPSRGQFLEPREG